MITATRDLPPGYRIEIKLNRMPDDFVIWVGDTQTSVEKDSPQGAPQRPSKYRIVLDNLRISVEKCLVQDRIFNYYYNGLKNNPEIPFTRNMIRSYTKMSGVSDLGYYNFIEQAQLPECVYVVFVPLKAYDGDRKSNPFNFLYLPSLEATLVINNRHFPLTPLTNTQASGKKRDFYQHFLDNTGLDHFNSQSVNISYKDFYERGYHILAWDLTSSGNNRFTR